MSWTTEPPTRPGWYWAVCAPEYGDCGPEPVRVTREPGYNVLIAARAGDSRAYVVTHRYFARWYGPVGPPPWPEPAGRLTPGVIAELRAAGADAWDEVDDPAAFLGRD